MFVMGRDATNEILTGWAVAQENVRPMGKWDSSAFFCGMSEASGALICCFCAKVWKLVTTNSGAKRDIPGVHSRSTQLWASRSRLRRMAVWLCSIFVRLYWRAKWQNIIKMTMLQYGQLYHATIFKLNWKHLFCNRCSDLYFRITCCWHFLSNKRIVDCWKTKENCWWHKNPKVKKLAIF